MNFRGNAADAAVIIPNQLRVNEKAADIAAGPGHDVHYELYGAVFKEGEKYVSAFKAKGSRLL